MLLQGKRAAGEAEFISAHRAMRKTVGLSHKPKAANRRKR
jgi:hypothetical protein